MRPPCSSSLALLVPLLGRGSGREQSAEIRRAQQLNMAYLERKLRLAQGGWVMGSCR